MLEPLQHARRSERFFARPQRATAAGLVLVAAVLVASVLIPAEPLAVDRRWLRAMRSGRTAFLHDLARVFDALGHGAGIVVVLGLLGLVLVFQRRWFALLVAAGAEGLAALASAILKAVVGRERPRTGAVETATTSFPSGHTTYAAVTCVAAVLLFSKPGPRRRLWWALAVLGTVAMAWSRTYLQVHWLSDVLAGALLGTGAALLVFGAAQTRQ